jgi:hypothetical protein
MRTVDSGDRPVGVEDNLPGIVLDEAVRTLDVHGVSYPARRPVRVDLLTMELLDEAWSAAWRESAGTEPGQSREERAALAWDVYRRRAQT